MMSCFCARWHLCFTLNFASNGIDPFDAVTKLELLKSVIGFDEAQNSVTKLTRQVTKQGFNITSIN